MKHFLLPFLLAVLTMSGCMQKNDLKYPVARVTDSSDNYFGTVVADPYRWLENDTSEETARWVEAQNALTESYLSKIPYREKIREKLTKMWNYPRYGVPFKEAGNYFWTKNDGLQNQAVLYVKQGPSGTPRVLLDPNSLSKDGTLALAGTEVSKDGRYMAFSLSQSGSDWNTIQVMEVSTGKVLSDTLRWVKFSGMAWLGDGFFYSRYDAPAGGSELSGKNENQKVCFHKVGTTQAEDRVVFSNPSFPMRNYGISVTEDERFLVLYESESTSGTAIYYRDLTKTVEKFHPLATGFDYEYNVIDNIGDKLLVLTNQGAPRKRLVLMDPVNPKPEAWTTLIPEKEEVLEAVHITGDCLVAEYMKDAASKAYRYRFDGSLIDELALPGIGTLAGFNGKKGDPEAFYGYTSFTFPLTVYRYDAKTNASDVYYRSDIDFDPDRYEVKQVFYTSLDSTRIPMFIVVKKGIRMNGRNPVLLYGYGGFNVSLTPGFSLSRLIFLENGGVFAMANLRGGGEYGEEWHKAGTKERKQNVFDDFIAAAGYLIAEKYTEPDRLAIMGGSNGGLLVGACMTQRPDLFRVAIPQVGVMDMLRYHKFTIGWAWASDYGTSDTKEGFDYLYKYSPLHNLRDSVRYPATLAFTADHDDRVVPAHTFKFMATLQAKHAGDDPVLVRIETKAGHGAGKPTAKLIDETTDLWSFVFYQLGMTFH